MSGKCVSPSPHESVVDELANSWDKHRRGWLNLADIQAQQFHGTAIKVCDRDHGARKTAWEAMGLCKLTPLQRV